MTHRDPSRPVEILLVEDNPGDVRLLQEAFRELNANIRLKVAKDGAEAMEFVDRTAQGKAEALPELILLDLNLPKISGHDILERIKNDPNTRRIPVIVLTSSRADVDIRRAYDLHANAYLRKPTTLEDLIGAAKQIKGFWMEYATLPNRIP